MIETKKRKRKIGRPKGSKYPVVVWAAVDEETAEYIRRLAEIEYSSMSAIVRELIADAIKLWGPIDNQGVENE